MSLGAHANWANDLHVEATYRLTEALVEAERLMPRRIDLLSEVVFETDPDGRFIFLNSAWKKKLGLDPAACLGRSLCEFVLEDDHQICTRVLSGADPLGTTARPMLRMRGADGETMWMEVSVDLLADGGSGRGGRGAGRGGAVGVLLDVTQQKLSQDELAKLSLVASYTDNLVIITDSRGFTEWVNRATVERTGFSAAEFLGRKPGDLLQGPGTDPATVAMLREALQVGRSVDVELVNYTRSGEPYWVQLNITPIRDSHGVVERFVAVQSDSTQLHETQEELRVATVRAEAANEAKTQFLATVSHEMRTPLNAIVGSVDLARVCADPEELGEHLARIETASDSLLRLVNDILDVSKIEAGEIYIEQAPFSIRPCLRDALAPIGERAHSTGLRFTLLVDDALPEVVVGDPGRLRQIVTNLAENAVKFTQAGAVRVEAALATMQSDGDPAPAIPALEITVTDTGTGVPEEVRSQIFERFVQADSSTTRTVGGVGLGLNIVRSLVDALGGTVALRDTTGPGATFEVLLPLRLEAVRSIDAAGGAPPAGDPTPPDGSAGKLVLVAEDNDVNFAVLQAYLFKAGHRVERAHNGFEAVAAAETADLILMDVEMPRMDGLEATRLIRSAELERGCRPAPIVAVTGHALPEYRDRCLAAGCDTYLVKPIRMRALLDVVGSVLASN